MTDIKQMLKQHLKEDRQKAILLKQKAHKQPQFQESLALMNADKSGDQLTKYDANKMDNPHKISKNISQSISASQNNNESINSARFSLPIIQEYQELEEHKTISDQKNDIFQKMIEEERKQEGSIVVKFGNEIQIQPKFMKVRGSMCSTELWSLKQRKELCQEYIRQQKIEKGGGENISSTYKKGFALCDINISSPFELNQIIDSRKYRMPQSDRTHGVSYFKPERMGNQANLYLHLKAQKQGVQLSKQSTLEMIENTINTKLPLDLKFSPQLLHQNEAPSYLKQTASSTSKLLNNYKLQTKQMDTSPENSPISNVNTDSKSFNTLQASILSNYSSQRNSIFKSPETQNTQTNPTYRDSPQLKNKGRSNFSLHLPRNILPYLDLNSNNNNNNNNINNNINTNRSNLPLSDRALRQIPQSPQHQLNSLINLTGNKNQKFSIKSSSSMFPSQVDFNSLIQSPKSQQNQVKNSMNILINRCNNSLIESLTFQQQISYFQKIQIIKYFLKQANQSRQRCHITIN